MHANIEVMPNQRHSHLYGSLYDLATFMLLIQNMYGTISHMRDIASIIVYGILQGARATSPRPLQRSQYTLTAGGGGGGGTAAAEEAMRAEQKIELRRPNNTAQKIPEDSYRPGPA